MTRADLERARWLTQLGVPVVPLRPHRDTGGWTWPRGWNTAPPDPDVIDTWRPGRGLAAVTGHLFDVLDVDPRAGGEESLARVVAAGLLPRVHGQTVTPSGGRHLYVTRLGIGSPAPILPDLPGLDLRGGRADGTGRGLARLPPTAGYAWSVPLDPTGLDGDPTGQPLTAHVTAQRTTRHPPAVTNPGPLPPPTGLDAQRAEAWLRAKADRDLPAGLTDGRKRARNALGLAAGALVAGMGLDRQRALALVLTAAHRAAPDHDPREARTQVERALAAGALRPRRLPDRAVTR